MKTDHADTTLAAFRAGLQQLDIFLSPDQVTTCMAYLDLLCDWNRAYNLTAVDAPAAMVTYHLLDSLAVLPHLRGQHCIDVGTGAGLPGLILAIADPDRHWVLLDSNKKRLRFVNQALLELKLANADTVHGRVEDWTPQSTCDTVITRAYGHLTKIWRDCHHLLAENGRLLAMKSTKVDTEIRDLASLPVQSTAYDLHIPGLDARRTLVVLQKAS